jgi:brefeldin A-inhibited guanine nucleotide-exchange protein
MVPKNIECIKTMVALALNDGNSLNQSWAQVLQCISQLARLDNLSKGLQTDHQIFGPQETDTGGGGMFGWLVGGSSKPVDEEKEEIRELEMANADIVMAEVDYTPYSYTILIHYALQVDIASLDRVFSDSVHLNNDTICIFVTALCKVAATELMIPPPADTITGDTIGGAGQTTFGVRIESSLPDDLSQPRIYSLQKLVEVADLNMGVRPRLLLGKIWRQMSYIFSSAGCHANQSVAMYAIDSLKQLSLKVQCSAHHV